jgi:hypothetical protein
MPFDPDDPSFPVDPSPWPRIRTLPRFIVHPQPPPSSQPSDGGIDDWFVPDSVDGGPDDWFVPQSSTAPGAGQPPPGVQPNPANFGSSYPAMAPRDPFAAYWSMIPADRVGAMAWDPPNLPLFSPLPSSNNFAALNPPSGWPIPAGSRPPTLGLDELPWSSTRPPASPAIPEGSLLGGLAKLRTPSPGGLFGSLATFGIPRSTTPALFSGRPSEAISGVGDQYAPGSFLGSLAGLSPTPASQSAGASGFPSFNADELLPPNLSAKPTATTTPASFVSGEHSPAGSAIVGSDANPIWRFLNALNPISSARAAEDEGGGLPPTILQALIHGLLNAATAKRLVEQQRILKEAEDARRELFEVAQGRASSRALGVALEASGVARPAGYAAHHIAAGGDVRAEFARSVLQKFKIGINDAANGVFLPANKATQVINGETIHQSLHTDAYYRAVDEALKRATTRQQVIDTLRNIGRALQSGDYP